MPEQLLTQLYASIDVPQQSEHLPIIRIDVWAIVISLLNLLILFLLIRKFLYKPVKKVFAQRKAEVEKIYKEASDAKEAANADKEYYLARKEAADEEAEEVIRRATDLAKKTGDEIVKDAKAEAEAVKAKAERDIEQEKVKALNDAKSEIASISVDIAEKIVQRELNSDDQRQYVDRLVRELDGSAADQNSKQ